MPLCYSFLSHSSFLHWFAIGQVTEVVLHYCEDFRCGARFNLTVLVELLLHHVHAHLPGLDNFTLVEINEFVSYIFFDNLTELLGAEQPDSFESIRVDT